ncbi:hypothetical protein RvY_07480 [Ramazzottius varieornatus]|uniref:Conserved oligomeric Golgi complex subunit 4 n=1 Tax=Ramazzottius varieornatus TaxID=947166 RepID=A0A1D1V5F7_RAMVA|nr:hypothetical protein RvY_07480 [Ramazzottius varieornatus]
MAYMHRQEAEQAFHKLCAEEDELNREIGELLAGNVETQKNEKTLLEIRDAVVLLEDEAAHLKRTLGFSAELADSVSGKIRHLDSAKHIVEECLQRIEDVLDLSFCTEGVRLAMENEEYEVAAMHVNRFLKMDKSGLLNSADDMQQRSSLKESLSLLQEAQHKLETIINVRFEEALNTADVANVERLFKIFPLLNLHAVGLKKFCTYLCSNISDKAQSLLETARSSIKEANRKDLSTSFFVELITKFVETVAHAVETYEPLVETYYGSGYLFHFVEYIQSECDRQGVKMVEEFVRFRQFSERAKQIRNFARRSTKSTSTSLHSVYIIRVPSFHLRKMLLKLPYISGLIHWSWKHCSSK